MVGSVGTNSPKHPQSGIDDGQDQDGECGDSAGFSDGSEEVGPGDSQHSFAEYGHGFAGDLLGKKSAPDGRRVRSLRTEVGL